MDISLSQAEDEHFLFTSEVYKPVSVGGSDHKVCTCEFISAIEVHLRPKVKQTPVISLTEYFLSQKTFQKTRTSAGQPSQSALQSRLNIRFHW